jgi:HSP20 family protein
MNLIRFSPRSFTPWFEDFDRFFENGLLPSAREPRSGVWSPGVDIVENEKQIVLRADLPGVDEKNIDIQVEDGTLTLKAERKFEKETKEGDYHRVERAYGSFHRSFSLPENADADHIAAAYKKGVLEVTIPKVETKAKAKKVQVVDVK